MADPAQGDWRGQGAPKGSAAAGPRAWQQQAGEAPAPAKPWSRTSKLFMASGVLSVVLVGVVWLIIIIMPAKPACLVLIGAGYEENLLIPHNVYGYKGLLDLKEASDQEGLISSVLSGGGLTGGGREKLRLHHGPKVIGGSDNWAKVWSDVDRKFKEKTVVIFLSLHGGADGDGPYFIFPEAKGLVRVHFEKQLLKDLQAPEFKEKQILLIVDGSQVRSHWPLGIVHNDFAKGLKALKEKIEAIPNLVVLASADVDQLSWPSEEWRRTIFAHYVIEGIKGAADLDGNGYLKADELFKYVHDSVKTWAQANRDAVQTPVLLGNRNLAEGIDLVQVTKRYPGPDAAEAPGRAFVVPKELTTAWEDWLTLRAQTPAPPVYSPTLWREYQETLLRYEQLVRAGDPTTKAGELQKRLGALKTEIIADQTLGQDFSVQGNAFPMAGVLGLQAPWSAEELDKQFRAIWLEPKVEQRTEAMSKVVAWAKDRAGKHEEKTVLQMLQNHLCRALLKQVIDANTKKLAEDFAAGTSGKDSKTGVVLSLIVDTLGKTRSAETHLLAMVLAHADAKVPLDLVQQALRVRLLAEETALGLSKKKGAPDHPYSEITVPWIRKKLEAADEQRRLGEDWLFGDASSNAWEQAKEQLSEAEKNYLKAQDDAAVIARAWDVRDRAAADLPFFALWLARLRTPAEHEKNVRKVEELASQLDALTRRLDIDPQGKDLTFKPGDQPAPPLTLEQLLTDLTAKVAEKWDDLTDTFQRTCVALRDAPRQQIHWYELEAALSAPLLTDLNVRLALLRNSREISSTLNADTDKYKGVASAFEDLQKKEMAHRQHRLAFSVLDKTVVPEATPPWTDEGWREAVRRTEEYLDKYHRALPEQLVAALAKSVSQTDLSKAERELRPTEALSRALHAGAVADTAWKPFTPPVGLRQLRMYDLLLSQARRTVGDHWFDDPRPAFYEGAARLYLTTAKALAVGNKDEEEIKRQRESATDKELKDLKVTGLSAKNKAGSHWTTEDDFPLKWEVTAEQGVPKGKPMLWLEMKGEVKEPRKAFEQLPAGDVVFTQDRGLWGKDEGQSLKAVLRGIYRGQEIKDENKLWFYPNPDQRIAHYQPNPLSALGVRLDKSVTYGAISIVVDGSKSMERKDANGISRYEHALKALDSVLKTVPPKTHLSLLAYFDNRAVTLLEPTPWSDARRGPLLDNLRTRTPLGGTPLAATMVKAKEDGFPPRGIYQGAKVLLALTDGAETDYMSDGVAYSDPAAVRKFLRASFADSGIEVNVVCFNEDQKETGVAKQQFQVVEQEADFTPAGRFIIQADGDKLGKTLEETIRPRLHLYEDGQKVPGFPKLVSRDDRYGSIKWFWLPPKDYKAKVQQSERDLGLKDGDRLLLALKEKDRQLILERSLFANLPENSNVPASDRSDPRSVVTLLENQIQNQDLLTQLFTLEDTDQSGTLVQRPPGLLWLELAPPEKRKLSRFFWCNDWRYPAPAFHLEARPWPVDSDGVTPSAPELRLWWSASTPKDDSFSIPVQFGSRDREVKVGSTKVQLESIKKEEREIELNSSGERTKKTCVVVRLAHLEPGKRVIAQIVGRKYPSEHQYFTVSDKYTAIFHGLSDPEGAQVKLISLEDFKNHADTRKATLRPQRSASPPPAVDESQKTAFHSLLQDHP